VLVPLSFTGVLASSPSSQWERVAATQAKYATELAAEHVQIDEAFHELAKKFVSVCELTFMAPNESRGLGRRDWHHLYLYTKGICRPWLKRWHEDTRACELEDAPDWCIDHDKGNQRFDPMLSAYFGAFASELHSSPDPLARYNMMALVMDRIDQTGMHAFPAERVAQWLSPLLREFLASASGDDAVEIAATMKNSWAGLSPESRQELRRYATESTQLSSGQRERLLVFAAVPE